MGYLVNLLFTSKIVTGYIRAITTKNSVVVVDIGLIHDYTVLDEAENVSLAIRQNGIRKYKKLP
jgi:hypothetical protein